MRTLHFYITRQVLTALLLTVMVFTFVLLLGNVLKEVMALIINGQASLRLVGEALLLLIPFVLVFALPMGMLTATLLVFGRLSADQELTAVRASGISLLSLTTPVLLLSVAASVVSGWINLEVGPWCRTAYRGLVYRVGIERVTSFIEEDRFMDEFEGFVVYVGRKSATRLDNVLIYELTPDKRMKRRLHADWAEILADRVQVDAVLRLHQVTYYDFVNLQPGYVEEYDGFRLNYRTRDNRGLSARISDLTFWELWRHLQEVEALSASPPVAAIAADATTRREQLKQLQAAKTDLSTPIRVQMHRQIAFSFACIGFTLIGIPLGVRAHRRETSVGIAMALILVLVYYAFIVLAKSLEDRPEFGPHLIMWLPNLLFQVVGAALLWRANRGL